MTSKATTLETQTLREPAGILEQAPAAGDPWTVTPAGVNAAVSRTSLASLGWREAIRATVGMIVARPTLIGVGLLGFLARGGLVLFVLPIVALPTPTGISNFLGGTALTGAGASDGLVRLLAAAIALVVVVILAGMSVGAVADILLAREARAMVIARQQGIVTEVGLAVVQREAEREVRATPSMVARLVGIRLVALLPVALAVAWATARLVAAGYHQLILPDDLSVPLAIRILREAIDATLIVVGVWFTAELIGGLAVRHAVLGHRTAPVAFGVALAGLVRRPITTLATFGVGTFLLAVTALPTLILAALLWSRLQGLLADDVPIPLLVPATFVFVTVWGAGLVLVGVVAAARSVLLSVDVARTLPLKAIVTAGSAARATSPAAVDGEVA